MPLTVKQRYIRQVDSHPGFAGNYNSVTWATLMKLPHTAYNLALT